MADKNLVTERLKKSMEHLQKEADTKVDGKKILEVVLEQKPQLPELQNDTPEVQNPDEENNIQPQNENENNSPVPQEPQQQLPVELDTSNIVVTYNNPMQNLITSYNSIIKKIADDEAEIMSGLMKRPPQSDIYANATIQVRRDIYGVINEYILDKRLGKTKVLNEIFMLGIQEFIKKYSKSKDSK